MNKEHKTTEFSLHISRSKMRRYLHGQLNQKEVTEVETHLKHCIHCSETIVQYVMQEEPDQYKVHMKALKGKIIESAKPRTPLFSQVQIKTIQAAAAVVILLSSSFFAFDTLIDKDFSLISEPQTEEATFVRKSVFPEDQQTTKKVSTQVEKSKNNNEKQVAEDEAAKKPAVKVAQVTPKRASQQKPVAQTKPKKGVKKETIQPQKKKAAKPQLAQKSTEQPEEVKEVAEVKQAEPLKEVDPVAKTEKTTEKEEEKAVRIAPIQKLEKVSAENEANNLVEEKTEEIIPSATIDQLRQQ